LKKVFINVIKDLKMERKVFKNITVFDGFELFRGSVEVVGKVIGRIEKNEIDIADSSDVEVITGDYILMPGMINLHTHIPMTLFKGVSEDLPLEKWLHERIFPLEAKFISAKMCNICGMFGMAELLRSGVTTFSDMYFFEEAVALAAREINIRAMIGEGVINFPSPAGRTPDETIEYTEHLAQKYKDDELISVCCAPHSPYLTEEKYLLKLKEISDSYKIPFHIHMAESRFEVEQYKASTGKTEFERFEELGLLSERFVGAHCVNLADIELEIMARNKVTVAHCPSSNMKLGSGIARVAQMLEKGINVAVATDGSASNNNLNLLAETELASKLQKVDRRDPTVFKSIDALKAITSNAGFIAGKNLGTIKPGAPADLVLIKTDSYEMSPVYDPAPALLYASSHSDIEAVFVAGKKVVENGHILTIDEENLKREFSKFVSKVRAEI